MPEMAQHMTATEETLAKEARTYADLVDALAMEVREELGDPDQWEVTELQINNSIVSARVLLEGAAEKLEQKGI